MTEQSFSIYNCSLSVRSGPFEPSRNNPCGAPDWETYNRIKDLLANYGYTVGKDPRIERDYKVLSNLHNYGRYGDLEFKSHVYLAGCQFEFYQNLVVVNSNGGEYDFDKREKMPYLVGLRWQHTINKIKEYLLSAGFTDTSEQVFAPASDPLKWFNQHWDPNRFNRRPDGWPDDKKLNCWSRRDADGNTVSTGDLRWARDVRGYFLQGRIYDGINGRWQLVYGPGINDYRYFSVGELFTYQPSLPRKKSRRAEYVLQKLIEAAVKAENFEKAAVLRDVRNAL